MNSSQKSMAIAAAVVVVLVVVVAVLANRSSSSSSPSDDAAVTSTSAPSVESTTTTTAAAVAPTSTTADPSAGEETPSGAQPASVMTPVKDLPLDVSVDGTKGVSDGDAVTVHVTAKDGSKIFGADARLCRGDAVIENSGDYAPTQGGQCIAGTLSAGSDGFVEAPGAAPYASLDLTFRAGVGTSTYTMGDGTPVSITCGPGHPCTLVVRFQIPNGFGFRSYPLSFA